MSTGWQHALEIHPPNWHFPAGRSWIAGSLWSEANRPVADVRAWLDDRPFLGLCALPRFDRPPVPGDHRPPPAGFSFLLEAHRGARLLRLERWDEARGWVEFARQAVTVAEDAAPPPAPPPAHAEELALRVLRAARSRPGASWRELAEAEVAAHRTVPLNTEPNPPFYGALEEPLATGRVRYGRLTVTGWLAHRERTVAALEARLDTGDPVPLLHGLPRRGVDEVIAGLRDADRSQFRGHLDVPAGLPLPVALRIFARLDDGRYELVFTRRFRPESVTGIDAGFPGYAPGRFAAAALALHRAARRQGVSLGGPLQEWRALCRAAVAFRAEAPAGPAAVAPPPGPAGPVPPGPLRVTVVTHNLNLEGAPWFAFELARFLAAQPGWSVQVVSPVDGPLRAPFAAAGLPVEVVDAAPLLAPEPGPDRAAALAALARHPAFADTDVVVANTMVAWWAVHAARRARRPVALYIHESASVRRFYRGIGAPALAPAVEAAFGAADRVVFIAAASAAVHGRLERRHNFRLLPSWIDLERLDRYAATHEPRHLRRIHGIDPAAVVFANVGTVCERKGQHVFLRAIQLLQAERARRGDRTPAVFLMVGGRPGPYLDALEREIAQHGLGEVRIIGEVPDASPYYRLADICVCSSFEESFPRVLMEAAAFERLIVSTNVHGIPELLGPADGWLVPPGDAPRLAAAMGEALEAWRAGDGRRARAARAAVQARHDARLALPRHAALIAATARGR